MNPRYCILYFALRDDQQPLLPGLLRRLLRTREFRSRAIRMGKVARISMSGVHDWRFPAALLYHLTWK